MKEFFKHKFEFDFLTNKIWCESLIGQEDSISDYSKKSMSHIINAHHIWIQRILNLPAESNTWDIFPIDYWIKLSQENYLKTVEFLNNTEPLGQINYQTEQGESCIKDASDILYHILNHSNYHRGQIAKDLRDHGLIVPVYNFITFK